jgi:hypothetical protein
MRWLALRACNPGQGGGGSAALAVASVDICSGAGTGREGGAALALLGSRRGWATDAVARAACLQPRAKVGEGQRCSRVHPWMSEAVMVPAGGGSDTCFALLASGSGRRRIGLPCMLAAQGGGEGGTAALARGGPGIAAL